MTMPILTIQQRARELGRIRIGVQVPANNGKTRPEKLDRFRITSASRPLIERIAELYGGEARDWDNRGSQQYEVITTATRLPVLVPPQPVSQYFELWSGGGCQRRCDGQTELLGDRPCVCSPDPGERECKPTTRLNVILRDVEGIGVFRLESHGYYSAVELPEVAAFLACAGQYVSAWLSLEQRTVIRDGQTRRWMVPTLEVDVTPAQLMSGGNPAAQIDAAPTAIEAAPATVPVAGKATLSDDEIDMARNQIAAAVSRDQLREVWNQFAHHFQMPAVLVAEFKARGSQLRDAVAEPADNVDALWQQVLVSAPQEWTTQEIEHHFMETTGVDAGKATAADVQRYLDAT
ncbi:MAG: hypothetical protein ACREX8_05135, partial [Gammaproteobacteria bacterium]